MRRNLTEHDARRLLMGGPLVLVTTTWRGNHDVMPAAWTTPLSANPPLIGVAVHPSRHTHDMIRFSEEFALNFPSRRLLNHAQYFGTTTGKETDKLEASKLPTFNARKVEAKLLDGCVAFVECAVEDALRIGDHTLFVGRVLAVSADEEAYADLMWALPSDKDEQPLHYLGGDFYAVLGEKLQARGPDESADAEDERRREEHARAVERGDEA